MEFQKLYLDTNIFIELAEGESEQRTLLFELIATQMESESLFLCTSELTMAELLVMPYRERDDALIQLYDNWIVRDSTWLEVGLVARNVIWSAAILRRQYPKVKLPDALHLATAVGFECSHFLTADSKLPATIELVNDRWENPAAAKLLSVVRPTRETLQAILESCK